MNINYHTIFFKQNDEDLCIYQYLSIESLFLICDFEKLYIHYYELPDGKLWNKILNKYGNKIELIKINIPIKLFEKFKYSIILKILFDYGGYFFEKKILFLKNIIIEKNENLFYKNDNNSLYFSIKESDITYNLFNYFLNNPGITFTGLNEELYSNIKIIPINYDNNIDNIKYIINKEIYDYSFGQYFHICNNSSYFCYNNGLLEDEEININIDELFNKITIFNLLVRYIFSKKYIDNNETCITNNSNNITCITNDKLKLINNLDRIYWINLAKSIDRNNNMINLLQNIDICNERIEAVDGILEKDIKYKYFYIENENYPNNSNKEYAILLSHLNVIEKYINDDSNSNNNEYGIAMICEDDLSLDFINYWKKDIKTLIHEIPNDWEILMLGYFSLNLKYNDDFNKWNNEWSAISYLVNKKNIKNKINLLKKDNKWICNENIMVADNYLFYKFNTYVYKYPYFTFPNDNDSTLHNDHIQYHKIYKMCNYLILENIVEDFL
jgi:hypothetical protein